MGSMRFPQAGAVVAGSYRVLRPLGQGGMGAVYVVEHITTGAQRALKILHPELCADERLVRLFQQEARIGHRIPSGHVVDVIDAGVEGGTPWLVMELLEGESLAKHVERVGPLPSDRAEEILGQIGHALAAAHAVGVVHRDLKPENVFVAVSRRQGDPLLVKLLDFGIAKIVHEAGLSGTLVGTPLWMAPEQITGAPVLPSTDVWAFGLLAFWALTGKTYWSVEDRSLLKHLFNISHEVSVPAASSRAAEIGCVERLPPGFDAWFARCVAPHRTARYSEVGAARGALRSLLLSDPAIPDTERMPHVPTEPVSHGTDRTEPQSPGRAPPVDVFISYAPADEALRARLEVHMSLLQRQGRIRTWHRGKVMRERALDSTIAARLEAAQLVLLLVSARFLSCDDCYENEMTLALRRSARGDARVIPILAEACDWAEAPFGHLAVLPENGKAVRSWRVQSEAWADIARGIRAAAEELAVPKAIRERRAEELRHPSVTAGLVCSARIRDPYHLKGFGTPEAQRIGREREVLACLEAVGPAGWCIWGEPGVGKTTFARHLALELAPHYADLQIEIDMLGTSLAPMSPETVMAKVIRALTGRHHPSQQPRDPGELAALYGSTLKDQRVVLLLDNARDSAQIAPLLPPSGSLLIITSREQLSLPGVQTFLLEALVSDDAVALARGIAPRLDEAAGHMVSKLCSFLPLLVSIVARGVAANAARATESIERLRAAREGMDAAEAVHRWALDRIDSPLRALWTALSVFPADFGEEAAVAVGGMDPGMIAQALHTLRDRGLLAWDERARRFCMHDRSREHARAHADVATLHEAERRHAEHFWCRLYMMQASAYHRAFCEQEETNIEAAQTWAEASAEENEIATIICCALPLIAPWCRRGRYLREGERWYRSGMAAAIRLGLDPGLYEATVRSGAELDGRYSREVFHVGKLDIWQRFEQYLRHSMVHTSNPPMEDRRRATAPERTGSSTQREVSSRVNLDVVRKVFDSKDTDDLLRFIRDHRVTGADERGVRVLLERFATSPQRVIDLGVGGERALAASVLDTQAGASDSALLVVLGYRHGSEGKRILTRAIELAEDVVRAGPKRFLEIPWPMALQRHGLPPPRARGYEVAVVRHRMARAADPSRAARPLPDASFRWVDLMAEHVEACTAALRVGHLAALDAPLRPRVLLRDDRVVGAVLFRLDPTGSVGEISALAPHPAYRGQPLADHLLLEAMRSLHALGVKRFVVNFKDARSEALELFRRHGFRTEVAEPTYRSALA